jgi:hypothetical protein
VLVLSACGSQRSTLPPQPRGASGYVPLSLLARYPEVYAQAELSTSGVVIAAGKSGYRLGGPGITTKIALEPASKAAADVGDSVRVSGLFSVSFETGYELALVALVRTGG